MPPIFIPSTQSLIPAGCPRWEDDFDYEEATLYGRWTFTNVGGSLLFIPPTANQAGVTQLQLAVGAGNRGAISRGLGQFIIPNGVFWQYNIGISLPALSIAADRFVIRAGLMDLNTGAPNNGVWFEYSDNENVGQWQFATAAGGVTSISATGSFATTGKASLKAYGFSNTQAIFSLNGNLVGSSVSNFPTGIALGLVLGIFNSSATALHNLNIDYAALYYNVIR